MRRLNFDKLQTASKGRMRDINEAIVLNLIREHQPISRVDIALKTGLQMSTVTVITKRLIGKDLIHEQGVAASNGGRRPRLLGLRAEKVCVFGLDIGVSETTLALGDFNGTILYREAFATGSSPQAFLTRVVKRIEHLMASYQNDVEFEGIGISATGIIDSAGERIIFSPNLGWRDVDIRALCEEALHLPVHIDNDARLSALAEAWHGNGREASAMNLVFVTVNEGIGSGIILNGQLYRGSTNGAGEFGHLSLDQQGPLCNCGNRGCWELYASDQATIRRFMNSATSSEAPPTADRKLRQPAMREVIDLAHGGDPFALDSIKTTAEYLGMGIANIVNTLNPELVVIGGEITQAWDIVEPLICKTLEPKVFQRNLGCVRIVPSTLEEKPSLIGAILQALSAKLTVSKVA